MKVVRKSYKSIAATLLLTFIFQWVAPLTAWALTGGPSQPEVQSFEPVGTSEMVDLFSGDFTYNIPLLDVGGYPINLSYNSGITMDQEASWVGLGWNINPGVINRSVRGMPDDFSGDQVSKEFSTKRNQTYGIGVDAKISPELVGLEVEKLGLRASIEAGLGVFYNNYKGMGLDISFSPKLSLGANSSGSLTAGMTLSANTQEGIGISPNVSLGVKTSQQKAATVNLGLSIGLPYNSRGGLQQLSIRTTVDVSANQKFKSTNKDGKKQITYEGRSDKGGENVSVGNFNGGASITFATPTYVPEIANSMLNVGVTINGKVGPDGFALHPYFGINAYTSQQFLLEKSKLIPAYGYMYAQNAGDDQEVLMDFNREKEGPYTPEVANLPITNFTYDIFSATGQGVGGTYRPFRNDVGKLFDTYASDGSGSGSLGVEVGLGSTIKGGADISVNVTQNRTQGWGDEKLNHFQFTGTDENNPFYEPVYFKNVGEKSLKSSNRLYDRFGGNSATKVNLKEEDGEVKVDNLNVQGTDMRQHLSERERRNQPVMVLTAEEAQHYALDRQIVSYKFMEANQSKAEVNQYITRIEGNRKPKHISEVTILRTDGQRYVYGIPAYNNEQREVTFAIGDKADIDRSIGIVKGYDSHWASVDNSNGNDHFYSATKTPPFAHSYLLTAILSPDYVDLTGDGVSPDDLGTATKVNYSRLNGDYQWRTPYGGVSYNEGFQSDLEDDKGNYIYGKKEIWYVHSIESKTHVAVFFISNREDGLGVGREHRNYTSREDLGNTPRLKKVDRLTLYSRQDWIDKGTQAYPIKTVHFVYDYSLCKNIQNHSDHNPTKGKLTLKGLYFTHGFSKQGMLSPYRFKYADINPDYHEKKSDRWGNYKGQEGNEFQDIQADGVHQPANIFPYVNQDRYKTDAYASAWNLEQITLPSGGTINVQYEADDYAYVQNKRAMQMFKILGFEDDNPLDFTSGNGTDQLYDGGKERQFLKFKLQEDIDGNRYNETQANALLEQQYFEGFQQRDNLLYFRCRMNLNSDADGAHYEYVSGYATIQSKGLCGRPNNSGNYTHGWIELKLVDIGDNANSRRINPITKAGFDYTRQNRQQLINQKAPQGAGILDVAWGLLSLANDVIGMIGGMNTRLRSRGFCEKVDLNQSWIKLNNPIKKKLGGGSRVRQLKLEDQWQDLTETTNNDPSEVNADYGQVYEYTMREQQADGTVMEISSGVAAYEPILGGDENPFRHPIYTSLDKKGVPSYRVYVEEPFGETFFPAPSVGYRRGLMKSIHNDKENLKKSAYSGYTVNEFYTAKEFPTLTSQTQIEVKHIKPDFNIGFFVSNTKDNIGFSQGYLVELNDMHGKPKSQATYRDNPNAVGTSPAPVSKVEYIYKATAIGDGSYKLVNDIDVIHGPKGDNDPLNDFKIVTATVGQEEDITLDTRFQQTSSTSTTLQVNLDLLLETIIPIPIPMIFPSYAETQNTFQSVALTKVINRYGILEKTVAHEEGATIETANMLFDAETGEVLVTRTQNEYKDYIYNVTFPAHWGYDRMGQAYKNLKLKTNITVDKDNGRIVSPQPELYFVSGDEIRIHGKEPSRYWIHEYSATNFTVLDENGKALTSACEGNSPDEYTVEIIRSGRRNLHTLPIQTITCLKNPIVNETLFGTNGLLTSSAISASLKNYQILDAQATEYSDQWQLFCCGAQKSKIILDDADNELRKAFAYLVKKELQRTLNEDDPVYYSSRGSGGDTPAPEQMWSFKRGDEDEHNSYNTIITRLKVENPSYNAYGQSANFIGAFDRSIAPDGKSMTLTLYNFFGLDGPNGVDRIKQLDRFFRSLTFEYNDALAFPTNLGNLRNLQIALANQFYRAWYRVPPLTCTITLTFPCSIKEGDDYNRRQKPAVDQSSGYTYGNESVLKYISDPKVPDAPLASGDFLLKIENSKISSGQSTFIKGTVGGCLNLFRFKRNSEGTGEWADCGFRPNKTANPYRANILGAWRKNRALAYYTQRNDKITNPSGQNERSIVRNGGVLDQFESYYFNKTNGSESNAPFLTGMGNKKLGANDLQSKDGWIAMERITKVNPWGYELEGKDTLGRYSASIYGYNNLLPIATATNARYQEIAFESFEDYGFPNDPNGDPKYKNYQFLAKPDACQPPKHFGFTTKLNNGAFLEYKDILTQDKVHSGNFAIKVDPTEVKFQQQGPSIVRLFTQDVCSIPNNTGDFVLQGQHCIGLFNPEVPSTKRFVVSVWVKATASGANLSVYQKHGLNCPDGTNNCDFIQQGQVEKAIFYPSGPVIEGWQKIEGIVELRPNLSLFKIVFNPQRQTNDATYFDDLRIHPFESAMKSYVFDARLNRLMAELDDRNFATFYEYDTEGRLIRTKKETERGVKTIHESRSHKSEIKKLP